MPGVGTLYPGELVMAGQFTLIKGCKNIASLRFGHVAGSWAVSQLDVVYLFTCMYLHIACVLLYCISMIYVT